MLPGICPIITFCWHVFMFVADLTDSKSCNLCTMLLFLTSEPEFFTASNGFPSTGRIVQTVLLEAGYQRIEITTKAFLEYTYKY